MRHIGVKLESLPPALNKEAIGNTFARRKPVIVFVTGTEGKGPRVKREDRESLGRTLESLKAGKRAEIWVVDLERLDKKGTAILMAKTDVSCSLHKIIGSTKSVN